MTTNSTKVPTRLTPGTYRLIGDDHPALRKDNRRKHDWKCQPIERGTVFFYTEHTYNPGDSERQATEQLLYPVGCYQHEGVAPNESSATRLLEECLERVEETPSLWLRRVHSTSTGLGALDILFEQGKLTMQDVQSAVAIYDSRLGE